MLRTSENAVKAEVQLPRNPIPRTPVNKGKKRAEAATPRPVCYACRYPLEGLTNNLGRGTGCPCGPCRLRCRRPNRCSGSSGSGSGAGSGCPCGPCHQHPKQPDPTIVSAISIVTTRTNILRLRVIAMLSVLLPQRSGPCGRPAELYNASPLASMKC